MALQRHTVISSHQFEHNRKSSEPGLKQEVLVRIFSQSVQCRPQGSFGCYQVKYKEVILSSHYQPNWIDIVRLECHLAASINAHDCVQHLLESCIDDATLCISVISVVDQMSDAIVDSIQQERESV